MKEKEEDQEEDKKEAEDQEEDKKRVAEKPKRTRVRKHKTRKAHQPARAGICESAALIARYVDLCRMC